MNNIEGVTKLKETEDEEKRSNPEENIGENIRLGMVAEVTDDSIQNIKDSEYLFRFNEFRKDWEVVLFDWKDVKEGGNLERYVFGDSKGFSMKYDGKLNDLVNIVHVGQLGKIVDKSKDFLKFIKILRQYPGKIVNNLDIIESNLSKEYLLDLQEKGFSIIPTIELKRGTSLEKLSKEKFRNSFKFNDLVVKPKIFGEKGEGVKRVSDFKSEKEFQDYLKKYSPVLAQPFIKEVFNEGEYSLVFLGDKFSHGAVKKTGEFLVNRHLDTRDLFAYDPSPGEIKLSRDVIRYFGNKGHTRVDYLKKGGDVYISEVEMINPACFEEQLNIMPEFSKRLKRFLVENFKDES